jgi:hypothetical protein
VHNRWAKRNQPRNPTAHLASTVGVRSVANLTSLSTGHSMDEEAVAGISHTLSALYEKAGGLHALKYLHFEPGAAYEVEGHYGACEMRGWIPWLISLCPAVVHYSGFLPDTTSVSISLTSLTCSRLIFFCLQERRLPSSEKFGRYILQIFSPFDHSLHAR